MEVFLDEPITRPTTIKESPDFAVEVALLSRNIVFDSEVEDRIGGHFWIFKTPGVQQTIEGIEIRNFGQQGNLGRYPIHFHYCGDVSGAVVARNTIRGSQQRCVVVHGTDNLVIEENVAFDSKGHCFMLEDGIETGNQFIRNLGAATGRPQIAIPDMGTNGKESDRRHPSTFWITNPSNDFVGNVAAGSSDSGFWIEPLKRGVRQNWYSGKPRNGALGLFKDNVVHSNGNVSIGILQNATKIRENPF